MPRAAFILGFLLFLASERPLLPQQVSAQDIDKILERADKLLEEAKTGYEEGRSNNTAASFIDAGFKLEEARIKYLVLQELATGDKQKLAVDRLRALNQLSKLIHDGKVAVAGTPADSPAALPTADPTPARTPVSAKVLADVTKRALVPDANKQRDAEKAIRDIYKEQYAKKAPADRVQLAKVLLDQADKSADDPISRWVLYREAQDLASLAGDIRTAIQSVEGASTYFDVDPLTLKSAAIAATAKSAKAPAEFAALSEILLKLADEFIAVDQYDPADKAAQAAGQHARRSSLAPLVARTTAKAKDVVDAKTRFASLKTTLESLARNPEDGAANLEMGQFLCFVKGSWDIGLRFLAKGSDPALKSAAEKDIAVPTQSPEQIATGDAWWDLSEKTKSPGAKEKLQARGLYWYEAALPGATGLLRTKIDKRLSDVWKNDEPVTTGLVGRWVCNEGSGSMLSDTSGKGNHGTLQGGVKWGSGVTGGSIDFESGGHVSCGVAGMPPMNGPLTLAWAIFTRSTSDQLLIVLDDAGAQAALSPGFKDGKLAVWKWGEAFLVSTAPPQAGEWHYVAYTFDRTTHKLYVDGVLKDSSTASAQSAGVKRLEFGQWVGGMPKQYSGQLDEIRIYSRALSDVEVKSLIRQRK